jgi:hypothetical protein
MTFMDGNICARVGSGEGWVRKLMAGVRRYRWSIVRARRWWREGSASPWTAREDARLCLNARVAFLASRETVAEGRDPLQMHAMLETANLNPGGTRCAPLESAARLPLAASCARGRAMRDGARRPGAFSPTPPRLPLAHKVIVMPRESPPQRDTGQDGGVCIQLNLGAAKLQACADPSDLARPSSITQPRAQPAVSLLTQSINVVLGAAGGQTNCGPFEIALLPRAGAGPAARSCYSQRRCEQHDRPGACSPPH